ncbi:MAG: mevalonate kinase [Promethearchaeota archaeon]
MLSADYSFDQRTNKPSFVEKSCFQSSYFGYGKIILFGEHFVVHGIPAIAAALMDLKTYAIIRPYFGEGILIEDHTMNCNILIGSTNNHIINRAIQVILKKLNINWNSETLSILVESNIPLSGGMGSSAAIIVALTRLLSDHFQLGLTKTEISRLAYEGEKVFAGTPSGIDNSISTLGGLLWYQKRRNQINHQHIIKPLTIKRPINIVIGNTGISHDTAELIQGVYERKVKYPKKYISIFTQARKLVKEAKLALYNYNLDILGKLMNKNHQLLQKIEVSSSELDKLVDISLNHGAFGAKLTGGGGGGCMFSLTPNKDVQSNVASAIENAGYQAIKTRIG